ncbi:MAG: serine/threonine protein kinase [Proteobacteria bacterium]|nr:serine/threonine protein kinase [Pseudomonadota bacterium]
MELDDIKTAWQSIDHRLQLDNALRLNDLRERTLDKTRRKLRPVFWGQIAQILFGLLFVLLATLLWRHGTTSIATILAGIVVHAYGLATIISAGVMLGRLHDIDNSAPILDIQKRLLRARTWYVRSGMIAGLPWWFLWVPILMTLVGLKGGNLYADAPSMVWIGLGVGAAGLLATWWFHRWSRNPRRPDFARKMDDTLTGGSLRKALAQVEELRQFEQE